MAYTITVSFRPSLADLNLPLHSSDYLLKQKQHLANKVTFIFSVSSCTEQRVVCLCYSLPFFISSLQMDFFWSILMVISTFIVRKTFFLTGPFGSLTFVNTILIDSQIHILSAHILLIFLFLKCNSNPVRLRPANTVLL